MTRLLDIDLAPAELAAALAGQHAARERIYQQLAAPVFTLISRLVPLRAAREDLFQDTVLAVFEHLPRFRGEAPFGAWVRRIAVNRCFMHLRSPWQRARIWLSDGAAFESEELQSALWREGLTHHAAPAALPDEGASYDVQRLLARLGPTARAIVWLHEVEGWSHDEIATASGRSVSFSKSQLARAHLRLRDFAGDGGANACRSVPRHP